MIVGLRLDDDQHEEIELENTGEYPEYPEEAETDNLGKGKDDDAASMKSKIRHQPQTK